MKNFKIIHEPSAEEPFLVLYKPHNIPSAPLSEQDENNALAYAISLFPEIKAVQGLKSFEYGLLHRIDTSTDGLLLIALNQAFFDHIIDLQNKGSFIKSYKAECIKQNADQTFPQLEKTISEVGEELKITSYFRKFGPKGKEVRPVTENSNSAALKKIGRPVLYSTAIKLIEKSNDKYTFSCTIKRGFRHQVRCHLAWSGYPIINDEVYNKNQACGDICFTAYKIEFNDEKGKKIIFEI